jgi:antirestriction protein ArdC
MQGRVSLPVRHNGIAYRGVNVLALWMQALAKSYSSPMWMTLVVYASSITRPETDETTGTETARDIHYLKGYTVFNIAQIDGLAESYYASPAPPTSSMRRIDRAKNFFAAIRAAVATAVSKPFTPSQAITFRCRPSRAFATRKALRHIGARDHPLDAASVPPCP